MTTETRAAIAAERRELAALLASLTDRQWDAPTLCEGWRVREVVAHMTMPYRYSTPKVLLGLLRARGSFDRLADRAARGDAASLTADELVGSLADNVDHPWKPPGGGYAGALSHDVIHGLDITVALGLDRRVPADRMRMVLDGIHPRSLAYFGVDLTGISLRADDLDWTFGSGTTLSGAAQDLMLGICGRILPAGHLHGEPSERFTHAAHPVE
ncbi:MAG: maleylpyruvate isomerase family mycothiol-dependent enzyme [Streptosporangiales bacterium]|nr:maleylpyruvate isomerase family mycothiol-dependent enzyme [Streptosporangiales bacterium]